MGKIFVCLIISILIEVIHSFMAPTGYVTKILSRDKRYRKTKCTKQMSETEKPSDSVQIFLIINILFSLFFFCRKSLSSHTPTSKRNGKSQSYFNESPAKTVKSPPAKSLNHEKLPSRNVLHITKSPQSLMKSENCI